jgi:hypothetical protein
MQRKYICKEYIKKIKVTVSTIADILRAIGTSVEEI